MDKILIFVRFRIKTADSNFGLLSPITTMFDLLYVSDKMFLGFILKRFKNNCSFILSHLISNVECIVVVLSLKHVKPVMVDLLFTIFDLVIGRNSFITTCTSTLDRKSALSA